MDTAALKSDILFRCPLECIHFRSESETNLNGHQNHTLWFLFLFPKLTIIESSNTHLLLLRDVWVREQERLLLADKEEVHMTPNITL